MSESELVPSVVPAAPAPPVAATPPIAPVVAQLPATPPPTAPAEGVLLAPARPVKTLAELLNEKGPDEAQRRMARAGRKALKLVGIDVPKGADMVAFSEQYKAGLESKKIERKEFKARAEKAESEIKRYAEAMSAYATAEMTQLAPEHQALIKAHAGEDPSLQVAQIHAWKAAGFLKSVAPASAAPSAAPAAPAPIPPPANSAAPQPGPVPLTPPTTDHLAAYKAFPSTDAGRLARTLYLFDHPELSAGLLRPQS